MNICIVSTYSCTFEDFSAVVDEYEETFKEFITEFELVKVNDHKSIMMCHCTDMEAFGEMMSSLLQRLPCRCSGTSKLIYGHLLSPSHTL